MSRFFRLALVLFNCFIHVYASDTDKLFKSAREGNFSQVKYLLSFKHVDLNARDLYRDTPLHYAAMNGHLKIVKYFVNEGADINTKSVFGRTPLSYAAGNGYSKTVRFLVKKGAIIDSLSIKIAKLHGYNAIVDYLSEHLN